MPSKSQPREPTKRSHAAAALCSTWSLGDHTQRPRKVDGAQVFARISFATVYNSLRYLKIRGWSANSFRQSRGHDRKPTGMTMRSVACGKLVLTCRHRGFDWRAARASRFRAESVHLTGRSLPEMPR
jgi:hypothetical protein